MEWVDHCVNGYVNTLTLAYTLDLRLVRDIINKGIPRKAVGRVNEDRLKLCGQLNPIHAREVM